MTDVKLLSVASMEPIERRFLLATTTTTFFVEAGDLWKTDASGTAIVVNTPGIHIDSEGDSSGYEVVDVATVNGVALFFELNSAAGSDTFSFWKSDGTAGGTQGLGMPPDLFGVQNMTAVGDGAYFIGSSGTRTGGFLWRATEAGAYRVYSGAFPELADFDLQDVNGTLILHVSDITDGEVWRSDGTEAGTAPAAVVNVEGTPAADYISVALEAGNYVARLNGQVLHTTPSGIARSIEVLGSGGDDTIDCSTAAIPIFAYGGDGADKMVGGSGPDTLVGGAQKDFIAGGAGNDRLNGNGGHDRLFGGPNADRLFGYEGNDWLEGGSSNDRLEGGNGNDSMYGVGGNDRFFAAGDGTIDQLFGGTGDDTAAADMADLLVGIEIR
jgi:Ca2+-binding RTX toxin-like protein